MSAASQGLMRKEGLPAAAGTLSATVMDSTVRLAVRGRNLISCHSRARLLIYQHATRDRDEAIAKALGGIMQQVNSRVIDQAENDA
jgi:hypothetical protein